MIGVQRPNGEFVRIEFQHLMDRPMKGRKQKPLFYMLSQFQGGKNLAIRAETVCNIVIRTKPGEGEPPNAPEILANGVSLCSMKDAFNKDRGRANALIQSIRQGVQNGGLSVEEAGMLIESYNNRPRKKVGITLDTQRIMEKING